MTLPEPSEPLETFSPNWYYNNEPIDSLPDDCVGFVYCITDTINNKRYIGKKLAKFKKTKQKTVTLKSGGKKKKKITEYVDSDWREYFGSNNEIKKMIEEIGSAHLFREILIFCSTTGEMSYIESKYQFQYDVILNPSKWYNAYIMCRVAPSHVKNLLTSG